MLKIELEQYITNGLSSRNIAKKVNKSQSTINYWLKKFSLKTKFSLIEKKEKKEKYICKYCNIKLTSGPKTAGHQLHCDLNPNKFNIIEKIRQSNIGRIISHEVRQKISISRRKYLIAHPDQVPYRLNHSSKKSYIEEIFEKYLTENNIEGWVYNYNFSIYRLDFAFPEWKLDIELDGLTHQLPRVIEIDKRRNKYLIENGWKVIRFTGKEIKDNIYKCVQIVCDELKNDKIIKIPKEFLHSKLEKKLKQLEYEKQKDKRKALLKKEEAQKVNKIKKYLKLHTVKNGIINELALSLDVSHTTIRRIINRNNIII